MKGMQIILYLHQVVNLVVCWNVENVWIAPIVRLVCQDIILMQIYNFVVKLKIVSNATLLMEYNALIVFLVAF